LLNQRWSVVHPSGMPLRLRAWRQQGSPPAPLADISAAQWRTMAERAAEPNG